MKKLILVGITVAVGWSSAALAGFPKTPLKSCHLARCVLGPADGRALFARPSA